jgi:phosphoserine aminotransferase
VVSEVLKWIKEQGGVDKIQKANEAKANRLYDAIDGSSIFKGTAEKEDRSLMNVTFVIDNEELVKKFLSGAKERSLVGLKGHRSVGGFRASIYNAMPAEGVDSLVAYMQEFEKENG